MATTSPVEVEPDLTPDEITLTQKPWVTIVWNDPVNLMSYVTYVFRTYFGYDQQRLARGDGTRRPGDARVRPVGHSREAVRTTG